MHRFFRVSAAALLGLAVSRVALGDQVTLRLSRKGPTTTGAELELRFERLDIQASLVLSRAHFETGAESTNVVLEFPSGSSWQAFTKSGDYWLLPYAFAIRSDIATEPLVLWPAGTLSGGVKLDEKAALPAEVTVRFRRLGAADPLEGVERCPVVGGRFSCRIPSGTLDLRFRVAGHVTEYLWGKTLAAGSRLDLGIVSFRLGASVVGYVSSSERGAPDTSKTRVVLRPSLGKGYGTASDRALAIAERSTGVDARGFFHIDAVAPGLYELAALQEGFAETKAIVQVIEGAEASLREPLSLQRPRELRVSVTPERDPEGRQWTIELFSMRDGGRDSLGEFPVGIDGRWSFRGLSAGGRYHLRMKTATGMPWWGDDEEFTLPDNPTSRRIELRIEQVQGNVRIGSAPLAAHLKFGGRSFLESVETMSRQDGTFQVALPRLGTWDVNVSAAVPPVARTVKVEVSAGKDGRGEAEITLGDHALNGEIVDEAGQRIRAIITVRRVAASETFQKTTDDGLFRFEGLVPGTYIVYGASETLSTDGQEAQITKGEDAPSLKLVAKRPKQIRGRLIGPDGRPVVGAIVLPLDAPGVKTGLSWRRTRTDLEGRFVLDVSPALDERCVLIAPPGMAADTFHLRAQEEEQVVQADQHFGALALDYPVPHYDDFAMLFRRGCIVLPHVLAGAVPGAIGDDGTSRRRYRFPTLQTGPWILCMLDQSTLSAYKGGDPTFGRCSQAVVPSGAEASISIPK